MVMEVGVGAKESNVVIRATAPSLFREQVRKRDGDQVPDDISEKDGGNKNDIKGKLPFQKNGQRKKHQPDRLINQLDQQYRSKLQG